MRSTDFYVYISQIVGTRIANTTTIGTVVAINRTVDKSILFVYGNVSAAFMFVLLKKFCYSSCVKIRFI